MDAQQIIEKIKEEAGDLRAIKAALEDGSALAALGITDADQEAVEDARFIVKNEIANRDKQ